MWWSCVIKAPYFFTCCCCHFSLTFLDFLLKNNLIFSSTPSSSNHGLLTQHYIFKLSSSLCFLCFIFLTFFHPYVLIIELYLFLTNGFNELFLVSKNVHIILFTFVTMCYAHSRSLFTTSINYFIPPAAVRLTSICSISILIPFFNELQICIKIINNLDFKFFFHAILSTIILKNNVKNIFIMFFSEIFLLYLFLSFLLFQCMEVFFHFYFVSGHSHKKYLITLSSS